jgi:glycosyltransferase involved in cell wall biosynthesis
MRTMKIRLTLITEIIAPYRIPVFNALAAREDIDLHVIFLAESDASFRQWTVYKNEIHFSYEVLPSLRRRLGEHNILLNRGVAKALEASSPQVILCGGYNYLASWQAAYWARRLTIPFLLWIESTAGDARAGNPFVESLKRRFFRLCRAFVVPGRASSAYVRSFGIPETRIFVAPNAIDTQLFRDSAAEARQNAARLRRELRLPDRYFLNVGRLVPAKGVFDLLDAYAKLDPAMRSEVSLLFVGDGVARAELAERARAVSPGAIEFRGFLQRDELPAYYALAEALVFPTHSDTWGFVVNEAMASGIPVIASAVAGCVPDLVADSVTGFVVPSSNPASLAQSMTRLFSQPDLHAQMGRRASDLIDTYSPQACASGIASAAAGVLQ